MTHSTNFFEHFDDYWFNQLKEEQKNELEAEFLLNSELKKEVEFQMEIWEAINEKDILSLRGELRKVVIHFNNHKGQKDPFELVDDCTNNYEIGEVLTEEEHINFNDGLPKVHAFHQKTASNEIIHEFYKDQHEEDALNNFEKDLDEFDFLELEGLEEAMLEKDILNLRHTLKQVQKTVTPQFTVKEIDEFVKRELSVDKIIEFEKDFIQNKSLKEEIELNSELQNAVMESDIINLRNKVTNIIQTETSWNVSEKSIEDYIDGCLEGKELEEFKAELNDNTDLRAEVKLRERVNKFLGETDIIDLIVRTDEMF